VEGFLRNHDLRYAGLGDERYLCRKDDRTTLVAPVQIDGIDEFFAFIRTLIDGYETAVPPCHTGGDSPGGPGTRVIGGCRDGRQWI
jgi:hypothetical protein